MRDEIVRRLIFVVLLVVIVLSLTGLAYTFTSDSGDAGYISVPETTGRVAVYIEPSTDTVAPQQEGSLGFGE